MELSEVVIVSVYSSPNKELMEYELQLEELVDFVAQCRKPVVIGGGFNSRLRSWGDTLDTERGWVLVEAMASVDSVCTNRGTRPTCERGLGSVSRGPNVC